MKNSLALQIIKRILLSLLIFCVWIVFVILPVTELLFKGIDNLVIKKLGEFLFVAFFAVFPFALFLKRLVIKLILKPILEIKEITKILATGNLEKRLPEGGSDELAEVSVNINKIINNLLSSLQSMIHSLRLTHEKESQLSQTVQRLELAKVQIEQSANALQQEKNKLLVANLKDEAILSSIGEAVIAIDERKIIFLFNRVASEITGIPPSQAIGQPYQQCLKMVTEKEGEPVDLVQQVFSGQNIQNTKRLVILNIKGEKIPIAESTSPIINSQSGVQGVVIAFRDMTRERQLDRMKDEFVSVASHELRTPMTAIKGMLSMILDGDYGVVNEYLKEPLGDIANSSNRLIDLVNDMLDVSRIEAGRIKINLTKFKISEVISEIVTSLSPIALQKNIQLKMGNQSDFTVQGDLNKLKQILSNLVGNSLKFTDQGGITISSQLDHELVKVYVTDTGMGISPEDQTKLFGKFAQITSKQAGKPPGTGLGLYISKQLCQIMGGDLWIEKSEEGKGSIFAFSAPVSGTQLAQKTAAKIEQLSQPQAIPGASTPTAPS